MYVLEFWAGKTGYGSNRIERGMATQNETGMAVMRSALNRKRPAMSCSYAYLYRWLQSEVLGCFVT